MGEVSHPRNVSGVLLLGKQTGARTHPLRSLRVWIIYLYGDLLEKFFLFFIFYKNISYFYFFSNDFSVRMILLSLIIMFWFIIVF